jgi:hypothetical protein
MSRTNVDIIESAYKLLGVVGESQSVSAEQGATGLDTLNQLMNAWAVEDIQLGYFTQTSTTDTCPIPDWAEMGVISALAQQLFTVYPSVQINPGLNDDNGNGIGVIKRICLNNKLNGVDMRHLGYGDGHLGPNRFNILNGLVG